MSNKSKIQIRLAADRVNTSVASFLHVPRLFTPGEIISEEKGFMRLYFVYKISFRLFIVFVISEDMALTRKKVI